MSRAPKKYGSASEHLQAIKDKLAKQLELVGQDQLDAIADALKEAFTVGHNTTTTDDWCNENW